MRDHKKDEARKYIKEDLLIYPCLFVCTLLLDFVRNGVNLLLGQSLYPVGIGLYQTIAGSFFLIMFCVALSRWRYYR